MTNNYPKYGTRTECRVKSERGGLWVYSDRVCLSYRFFPTAFICTHHLNIGRLDPDERAQIGVATIENGSKRNTRWFSDGEYRALSKKLAQTEFGHG